MTQATTYHDDRIERDRRPMTWMLLGGVALAQLLAFWMVCSQQVRKAEIRRAEWQVQQMALADCLEYIPGSTIASCSGTPNTLHAGATLASDAAPVVPAGATAMAGATPVSFNLR